MFRTLRAFEVGHVKFEVALNNVNVCAKNACCEFEFVAQNQSEAGAVKAGDIQLGVVAYIRCDLSAECIFAAKAPYASRRRAYPKLDEFSTKDSVSLKGRQRPYPLGQAVAWAKLLRPLQQLKVKVECCSW
jgi:hypothetical protein